MGGKTDGNVAYKEYLHDGEYETLVILIYLIYLIYWVYLDLIDLFRFNLN